jgi:hypothetical protein
MKNKEIFPFKMVSTRILRSILIDRNARLKMSIHTKNYKKKFKEMSEV